MPDREPEKGWLKRILDANSRDVASWPAYMREAAQFASREDRSVINSKSEIKRQLILRGGKDRYIVVPPVGNPSYGYPFWRIADTQSPIFENFGVIEIHHSIPQAEKTARALCACLNDSTETE